MVNEQQKSSYSYVHRMREINLECSLLPVLSSTGEIPSVYRYACVRDRTKRNEHATDTEDIINYSTAKMISIIKH